LVSLNIYLVSLNIYLVRYGYIWSDSVSDWSDADIFGQMLFQVGQVQNIFGQMLLAVFQYRTAIRKFIKKGE
jgi:hypothetical protein